PRSGGAGQGCEQTYEKTSDQAPRGTDNRDTAWSEGRGKTPRQLAAAGGLMERTCTDGSLTLAPDGYEEARQPKAGARRVGVVVIGVRNGVQVWGLPTAGGKPAAAAVLQGNCQVGDGLCLVGIEGVAVVECDYCSKKMPISLMEFAEDDTATKAAVEREA